MQRCSRLMHFCWVNCKKGEIYQMMAALLCGEELINTNWFTEKLWRYFIHYTVFKDSSRIYNAHAVGWADFWDWNSTCSMWSCLFTVNYLEKTSLQIVFFCIGSQLLKTSDKKLYLNKIELQFLRVLNMYEKIQNRRRDGQKRSFCTFLGLYRNKIKKAFILEYQGCTVWKLHSCASTFYF